jgi:hypothetical protein
MPTPFQNIFARFQGKVQDFFLDDLFISDIDSYELYLTSLLKSALTKFDNCKHNLSNRDDILMEFAPTLTEKEEEILSVLMLVEWLEKEVNNLLEMRLALSSSDFKRYAEANNMNAKRDLRDRTIERSEKLMTDYALLNFDFGLY